jgi:hypothetical protein
MPIRIDTITVTAFYLISTLYLDRYIEKNDLIVLDKFLVQRNRSDFRS